jgi:hypothetical protein
MRNGASPAPANGLATPTWVQTDEVHWTERFRCESFYYGPILTSQDVNGNTYAPTPFDISIDNIKLETKFAGYSTFLTVTNVTRIAIENVILTVDGFASGVSAANVGIAWAPLGRSKLKNVTVQQQINGINQLVSAYIPATGAHEIGMLTAAAAGLGYADGGVTSGNPPSIYPASQTPAGTFPRVGFHLT